MLIVDLKKIEGHGLNLVHFANLCEPTYTLQMYTTTQPQMWLSDDPFGFSTNATCIMCSREELKMTMSDGFQQVTPFDSKFPTKNISSQ